MFRRLSFLVLFASAAIACDKEAPEAVPEPACAVPETCPDGQLPNECVEGEPGCTVKQGCPNQTWTCLDPTEPAQPPATNPSTWQSVEKARFSPVHQAQYDKAMKAQKDLGKTLVTALTKSVSEDGFKDSIEFCRGAAPDIAEKMGTRYGVKIGRTSHKLRNPENTPPDWAADAVANQTEQQTAFIGPHGAFGVLSPIPTSDLCVNCHGEKDQLAEGVPEALTKHYPKDQATGFAAGDLRGWFWVEVPGPS